jgi:hypothetical protein
MLQVSLGFAVDAGERIGAWDEVYYTNGSSVENGIQQWFGTTGLLGLKRTSTVGRRLACLSSDCYLYYVRFSVVGIRGATQTFQNVQHGYYSQSNYAGDEAVFRVFSDNSLVKREVRLGGIPDSVVQGNAIDPGFLADYVYGKNPQVGSQISTFMGALVNLSFGGIRYRTNALGGAHSYPITGAVKANIYDPITLTVQRSDPWDVTIPIDLSCRGQPQMRGRWKIAHSADPQHITLFGSNRVSVPADFSGLVTLAQFDITAIFRTGAAFLNAHKLGKKKFQRRGRQSAKLLRH